jgi:phospholipase/carboxylesterase
MNITHKVIDQSNEGLLLYVFTNGEIELKEFTDVKASIIHCHIDSEGHDITEDELFEEKNVNHIVASFMKILNEYETQFPNAKRVVIGQAENAEVALDLLLKENEMLDGGILIKPLLNIALTDGIMIEDHTKVLIMEGSEEKDDHYIDEQEVADILSVNGYDVTTVEIQEGHELSELDVKVSMNWIHDNFYN